MRIIRVDAIDNTAQRSNYTHTHTHTHIVQVLESHITSLRRHTCPFIAE